MTQSNAGNPLYRKRARLWATLWTLLIFILCLIPSKRIPPVGVPLADKWAHFILFAIFSLLWLLSLRIVRIRELSLVFAASVFAGWLVEYLQGILTFLNRSQDTGDMLADAIGGGLGVLVFVIWRRTSPSPSKGGER